MEGKEMPKEKSAYRGLLLIPVQLGISLLVFGLGILGDSLLWSGTDTAGAGHPAPVFSLIGTLAAVWLFIAGTVIALVITAVRVIRRRKRKTGRKAETVPAEGGTEK